MPPHHPVLQRASAALVITFITASLGPLLAQDVTVNAPTWFNADNADADQPPTIKGHPSIEYPVELRKSAETGYVLIGQSVAATGKSVRMFQRFSHPYFRRAIEEAHGELDMRAAVKAKQPVDSFSWFAVIFNPASAKAKGPDATVRVLAVAPVFVPREELKLLKGVEPPMLWATLKINEQGGVDGFALESPADETFRAQIVTSLEEWRFVPARHAGVAAPAELRVPLMLLPPMKAHSAEKMAPPRALHREVAVYPHAMRANGLRGEVVVGFVVTSDGKVADATIVRSNNPGFEEAALEAVRKWTFQPATRDGKPMKAKMQVPIYFDLRRNGFEDGRDAARITTRGDISKLPPALQYDTPAKVRGVVTPAYPYSLLSGRQKGKVKAGILIDGAGKVVRVEIVDSSQPEFGLALAAALEVFSFEPALKNGKPTQSLLAFEQKFDPSDAEYSEERDMLSTEQKHPERIVSAGKLDAPLKPISRRPPVFPVSLLATSDHGTATVEIIVDEDGYVRLPRIANASAPAFGYAAVQAVKSWRFEPPTLGGKRVATRIVAPFNFTLHNRAEPDGAVAPP